jgi:hypothetical protein
VVLDEILAVSVAMKEHNPSAFYWSRESKSISYSEIDPPVSWLWISLLFLDPASWEVYSICER